MSDRYLNREMSLLEFNERVLAQAKDTTIPLLERLKYLCISSSNLDEFFEVRVGALKQMLKTDGLRTVPDGRTPEQALSEISERAHELVESQYCVLNKMIIPALRDEGIHIARRTHWNEEQIKWVARYFKENLAPVLSPLGVDPAHPFPRVANRALHFIVSLKGEDAFGRSIKHAVVQVPRSLPRVIAMPDDVKDDDVDVVFLSSIVHAHITDIFPGMSVTGCYQFRLTRNTNLFVDEETTQDLLPTIQSELLARSYGDEVRLEVAENCPTDIEEYLLQQFHLTRDDLYKVDGPVNLHRIVSITEMTSREDLSFPRFAQRLPKAFTAFGASLKKNKSVENIFDLLKKEGQIMLHHPYHSFQPVLDFLKQSAMDPNVMAIRMTLYRTGVDSPIVDHLELAAKRGKEVTVIVELKARFDEEANIGVAQRLQAAGAHVVYGVMGHKTHAKMILVVRKEKNKLKYYHHLGTGNYHTTTTRFYTDVGILSNNKAIGQDIYKIFQQLTSLVSTNGLDKLLQAPFTLKKGILAKLQREIDHAKEGKPAHFIGKMNGLQEPEVLDALYEASQAGVQIDLIVRGICCIRPGVEGLSENIRVRSIIGRFLEHPRIYYFLNGGEEELYCSSADLMNRNLNRRVETCFPIEHEETRQRVIKEDLEYYLNDNTQAWELQSDGKYIQAQPQEGQEPFAAQQVLIKEYS